MAASGHTERSRGMEKVTLLARVPKTMKAEFEKIARGEKRSISTQVEILLDRPETRKEKGAPLGAPIHTGCRLYRPLPPPMTTVLPLPPRLPPWPPMTVVPTEISFCIIISFHATKIW